MEDKLHPIFDGLQCPCGNTLVGAPFGSIRYCSLECMPFDLRKSVEHVRIYREYLVLPIKEVMH